MRWTLRTLGWSFGFLLAGSAVAAPVKDDFPWRDWGAGAFEEARRDGKFVLLSLQAWWCEPCHRMNAETYADADVRRILDGKFVPVFVDQDSHPELSQRFERWGWPATVIFGADGTEIVKLRGFYSPQFFKPVLLATIEDPSPVDYGRFGGPERGRTLTAALPDERRAFLAAFFMNEAWDAENGGWGNRNKLVDGPTLDYALERARAGDAVLRERVRAQLDGMLKMIDPGSGAVSQIARRDWSNPYAEYPMFAQEAALRGFAVGYALFGEPRYRAAAERIYAFLRDTLSAPDGGVYASMGRESFNPGIDRRRYARETGKAIAGILAYHDATGETAALALARRHADWALVNRALPGGGFAHGGHGGAESGGDAGRGDQPPSDAANRGAGKANSAKAEGPGSHASGGPFLADSLEMGRALLHLHRSSGERRWLAAARAAADFIAARFIDPATGGFLSAPPPAQAFMPRPVKQKDDNVLATRFFNDLFAYTGERRYRETAEAGMGYLTSDAVLEAFWYLPGVLQTARELTAEPLHLTVVGRRDDAAAQALYRAVLAYPALHKRAEWWDRRDGPLANPDVRYPELAVPAAFACSGTVCSLPVSDPAAVAAAADRLNAP